MSENGTDHLIVESQELVERHRESRTRFKRNLKGLLDRAKSNPGPGRYPAANDDPGTEPPGDRAEHRNQK
jgi:hypothetical protein